MEIRELTELPEAVLKEKNLLINNLFIIIIINYYT